jgi:hypothetical protein
MQSRQKFSGISPPEYAFAKVSGSALFVRFSPLLPAMRSFRPTDGCPS